MIVGPTHGGWGREVTKEAFREAQVGPRVVLRVGNKVDIVLSEKRTGKDRDFFKSAGINLDEKRIIVVKSNQAHRASFDTIVAETFNLDSPGTSTVNYLSLPFKYLTRPMYPIDRDFAWTL
jgi:microcystin degradation protein MlrC